MYPSVPFRIKRVAEPWLMPLLFQEKIFSDARKRMGTALDIFVVNSRGSLYQVRRLRYV